MLYALKINICLCFLFFCCGTVLSNPFKQKNTPKTEPLGLMHFTENKGQISDQFYQTRKDILYYGNDGTVNFYFKNDGLSYQLTHTPKNIKQTKPFGKYNSQQTAENDLIDIYRVDVKWLNCNETCKVQTEKTLSGVDNFYTESCPNGAIGVKSYQKIVYKQLYKGIDLIWYYKNGKLKYDYLVSKNTNFKQIKLQINGAQKININTTGELVISTPNGKLVEAAPYVTQNGKVLKSSWNVKNNIVSFNIEGYNIKQELTIDPEVRHWGTYYGGNSLDIGWSCATDTANNIFMVGETGFSSPNIATSGAFQTFFGGSVDAFMVKFNTNGVRLWGTYFGGSSLDKAFSCNTDSAGNLFVCGYTQTSTSSVIATAACHQPSLSGTEDAFLMKFNSNGIRLWSTYYGGTGNEQGFECRTDRYGNIFMSGQTTTSTGTVIASSNGHQTLSGGGYDAFLVKFNTNGTRLWATYYGGTTQDYGYSCAIDSVGNVYLSGYTDSNGGTAIATAASHQPAYSGGSSNVDGFLAKFDSSGTRLWGTYYGGSGDDKVLCCTSDAVGNVYISGSTKTNGGTTIATPGSHQPNYAGIPLEDGFIAKFNPFGIRLWGTYYGTVQFEQINGCTLDRFGNLFFCGNSTNSGGNAISTPPVCFQGSGSPGNNSAFFAKFNTNGVRKSATTYGWVNSTYGYACAIDKKGNSYMIGQTTSATGTYIATAASQQSISGNSGDAYLVKFKNCPDFMASIASSSATCQNGTDGSATLSLSGGQGGAYTYSWSPITSSLASISNLSNGTYTVLYTDTAGCMGRSTVSIGYINASPVITITASSNSVCTNGTATLTANGVPNYTWSSGSNLGAIAITQSVATTYSVTGTSSLGCVGTNTISIGIYQTPTVGIINNASICFGGTYTINAFGANTYTFSGGSNVVSPSVTTTYSVTGTSLNGCVSAGSSTVIVNVLPLPVFSITPTSSSLCSTQSSTLSAGGSLYYYLWNTGATGSVIVVNPSSNTNYTVTGTDIFLCQNTATISVSVNALPNIYISSSANTLCLGNSATLTANGANSYTWSTGGNALTEVVSPTSNTTYTVIGTDASGCLNTVTFTQYVTVCTDVENVNANEYNNISIYPNPSNGILIVSNLNNTSVELVMEIIDSQGKQVMTERINNKINQINITKLVNGFYIVKLWHNSELIGTKKVSKI